MYQQVSWSRVFDATISTQNMPADCTYSLALLTASKFGLPESIIQRARELTKYCDAETEGQSWESNVKLGQHDTSTNIHHVVSILEETAGKDGCIQIPPSYMSPPSFEGNSCVYILQIGDDERKMRYYVGETDSLARRLSEHRSKGKDWSTLIAVAIKIEEGKSLARGIESLVIQRMAKSGFDMVSIADGTSIR
jgi:hypothetical protein